MRRVRSITQRAAGRRRRAAAVVELAVISPVLLTMLFGIIQYGYFFMVRQTLINAAREGGRIAFLQTSVEPYSGVTDRVDEVMTAAGLDDYTVTMTHATQDNGWIETVQVGIPRDQVSLVANFFGAQEGYLTGTCSMRKAGVPAPSGG